MRVAIVYGSRALRDVLARAVRGVRGWQVAWTAEDGTAAAVHLAEDRPDALLIGLAAEAPASIDTIRRVMRDSPCLVLAVASPQAPPGLVMDAIGAGAVDAVPAPVVAADGTLAGVDEVVRKLRAVATLAGRPAARRRIDPPPTARPPAATAPLLVAIGASTGGPAALATVLGGLPATLAAAVVVVQHVDRRFAATLADWLGQHATLPVRIASEGEPPGVGRVTLAGTNDDMVVGPDLALHYRPPADGSFYHPSVDAFFTSLAAAWPTRGLAALLTGIGRDGAAGLLALRERGWHTIAQNEATSVVYGMPRAAREVGAADEVLAVGDIAPAIAAFVAHAARGRS